jgi:hypothetical protein
MTGFPSHLDQEAIRKTNLRPSPKLRDRRGRCVCVLERQMVVLQQHLYRRRNGIWAAIVEGREDPGGLGQRDVWHPRPLGHERFGDSDLPWMVARDQANQEVGVNGPHAAP